MGKIVVYPGALNPTHEISLSDGVQTWGLRLEDGPASLHETPITPSTVQFSGGGTKFGDWEPGMSHIEQRTWEGGRGQGDFVDDPTRYFDSKMAWTLTPGKLFPVPGWKFSQPDAFYTEGYQHLPGSMDGCALYGSYRRIAEPVTHSSNWAGCDSVWLWVRRVGTPSAALAVELWVNTSGYPDPLQIQAGSSIAIADVPENESMLIKIDLSGGSSLVGTSTFIVVSGQPDDNATNHWEVGIDTGGSTAFYDDGASWQTDAGFSIYHRILSAGQDRQWHPFEYQGAMYAVDQKADGTASQLFLNGDRGKASAAISTILTDMNKVWAPSQWVGAFVKIVAGSGKGQVRRILLSDNVSLAFSAMEVAPDSTSEYVIFHTPYWQDISPTSGDLIDGTVRSVCLADDFAAFAQGQSKNILKMRWNPMATPPAHAFDDDGTNKADLLLALSDAENGTLVYGVNADTAEVCQAAATPWGTGMQFDLTFQVGGRSLPINNLYTHDGSLYAFKPDGRYRVDIVHSTLVTGRATAGAASSLTDGDESWTINAYKGRWVKIVGGTGKGQMRKIVSNTATILAVNAVWATIPDSTSEYQIFWQAPQAHKTLGEIGFVQSSNNGEAALSYGLASYFSWGGYALLRLEENSRNDTLEPIGPDLDEGLPEARRGRVVDLLGSPAGILAAVQGDGYTSVLVLPDDGVGWHEVFRGWATGIAIDHIYFQDSYRPRLWVSIGGELVYQDWPRHSLNPLKDPEIAYHHEAILISSTIDMGTSNLPKLIKEINAVTENLAGGIEVALDYQINADVGSERWITAGSFQITPFDRLAVNQGEVYQIRFRLRLRSNQALVPPVVHASVLEGFARTPVKYQWEVQLQVGDALLNVDGTGYESSPDAFLDWLKQSAVSSKRVHMRAIWAQLDDRYVIVEPPTHSRQYTNTVTGGWGGQVQVHLREI